jgi:hypothetical protein
MVEEEGEKRENNEEQQGKLGDSTMTLHYYMRKSRVSVVLRSFQSRPKHNFVTLARLTAVKLTCKTLWSSVGHLLISS